MFAKSQLALAREITKLHEEILRGDAAAVRSQLETRAPVKGEITLVIGKRETAADGVPVRTAFESYVGQGLSRMDAIKAVARDRGVSKREIYSELEEDEERTQPLTVTTYR
ncbi:MAG: hypothetical protein WKF37_11110 [Bryobacteraceae bacterium]